MSNISGISNASYSDYGSFASGKKINSAADGAAELSIIEKQDTQTRGLNAGANNIQSAKDMLNVSDAALGSISDYLQRIRELAVQASNTATVSDSDRSNMQMEVEQLKQGISDVANYTSFNTKPLLDGSNPAFNIATDSNGNSMTVNGANATLDALGIADFDLTGDFNIDDIDKAIDNVSSQRSDAGAKSNALEYAYNYNTSAALYSTGAKSRLEDLDLAEAISEKKKQETLQEYAFFAQKKKAEEEKQKINVLFG